MSVFAALCTLVRAAPYVGFSCLKTFDGVCTESSSRRAYSRVLKAVFLWRCVEALLVEKSLGRCEDSCEFLEV